MTPSPDHKIFPTLVLLTLFSVSTYSDLPEIRIQLNQKTKAHGQLIDTQANHIVINKSRLNGAINQSWKLEKIESLSFKQSPEKKLNDWEPENNDLVNLADIIAWFPRDQQKTIIHWTSGISDPYQRTRLFRRMLKAAENPRIRKLIILNLCHYYLELNLPETALELLGKNPGFTDIFNSPPAHFKALGDAHMDSGNTPDALQAYASVLIAYGNPADERYQDIIQIIADQCVPSSKRQLFMQIHKPSEPSSP